MASAASISILQICTQATTPDSWLLQLRGRNLLPFGQLRQNLLAVCMDYLGFNLAANTAFIVIEHVSSAMDWDNSQGQLGVVNVTLLTVSDNNEVLFGLVRPSLLVLAGLSMCRCCSVVACRSQAGVAHRWQCQ